METKCLQPNARWEVMLNTLCAMSHLIFTHNFKVGIFILLIVQMKNWDLEVLSHLLKSQLLNGKSEAKPTSVWYQYALKKNHSHFSEFKTGILKMEITLVSSLLSTKVYS